MPEIMYCNRTPFVIYRRSHPLPLLYNSTVYFGTILNLLQSTIVKMDPTPLEEQVPLPGQWPADPQEDVPISEDRLWVDGCFDFSHHGRFAINTQSIVLS